MDLRRFMVSTFPYNPRIFSFVSTAWAHVADQWDWIKQTICDNTSTHPPSFCGLYGHGLINAKAAYDAVRAAVEVCPHGIEIQVDVRTDNWPHETSWEITNSDGDVVAERTVFKNNHNHWDKLCLPKTDRCSGHDYIFTIYDSFGDGLLSQFGGWYEVYVQDDILVSRGGNFDYEETTALCTTLSSTSARKHTPPKTISFSSDNKASAIDNDGDVLSDRFIIQFERNEAGEMSRQSLLPHTEKDEEETKIRNDDNDFQIVKQIDSRNISVVKFRDSSIAEQWMKNNGEGIKSFEKGEYAGSTRNPCLSHHLSFQP